MIQVDVESIVASHNGTVQGVDVTYENTTLGGVEYPTCPSWVTFTEIGSATYGNDTVISYQFTVEENTGATRSDVIVLECTDLSGETYTRNITVRQGSGEVIEAPIWQDTFYTANAYSVFKYSISYNGVGVYYGKSYCSPGGAGAVIQVNKICQNFLKNNIGDLSLYQDDVVENVGAVGDFALCDENDVNAPGLEIMNYRFLMDYASDWEGESPYVMTTTINGHLDPRMRALCTIYCDEETEIDYEINDLT